MPLPEGGYHCFNKVGDHVFDITSEQFGDVVLSYEDRPLQTREERAEAKARMAAIIPPLVGKYAPLMGVSPSVVSYRASRSRWGSCNPSTRRINFSYYLLLLPDICIEHVVVHELAHLLVSGHGPAFYKVMDRYFPRWKEARALARRTERAASP